MKVSFQVRAKLFEIAKAAGSRGIARCAAGIRIAELGTSTICPDGSVIVRAPGKVDRKISKAAPCSCDDVKYNKPEANRCKHVFAANAIVLASKEAGKQTKASPVA